jgi:hypothetical protein
MSYNLTQAAASLLSNNEIQGIKRPEYTGNEVPVLIILGQSNAEGRGYRREVPSLEGVTWTGQVRMYQ